MNLKILVLSVDQLLLLGANHKVYGEDAIFHSTIGENWWVGAVMDGCSSAPDSHFSSALFAKLVKKSSKTLPYLEHVNPDLKLDSISAEVAGQFMLNQIFDDVKKARKSLFLDKIELLSTLVIALVNTKTNQAWVNISGDGFYAIDGELTEVDQNNTPDFMAYYLDENFDTWLNLHTKSVLFNNVNELVISTDGAAKFLDKQFKQSSKINSVNYLLLNNELTLKSKVEYLENEHKLHAIDDVGILCYRKNN